MDCITQPDHRAVKTPAARLRRLARNREPQPQREVSRSLHLGFIQGDYQLQRALHLVILTRAGCTLLHVTLERKHFGPAHLAVEVRRKQPLVFGALHGVTSTSLPPLEL